MENEKNIGNENENPKKNSGAARRLRMGGYRTALIVAVIVAAVIVNMIVAALPLKYRVVDLTDSGMYDISETTLSFIDGLKDDVTIYPVVAEDECDKQLDIFLRKYAELSDHIKIEYVDPEERPDFVREHFSIEGTDSFSDSAYVNSLVVESAKRSTTVGYLEIYTYSDRLLSQYYSYEYYVNGGKQIYEAGIEPDIFAADYSITSALNYVTTDDLPKAYVTSGQRESAMTDTLLSLIDGQSIDIEELNLLSAGSVPADADVVIINDPEQDIGGEAADMLISYIDGGGKVIVVTDIEHYSKSSMPNLTSVANRCGLDAADGVVLESDSSRYQAMSPFTLVEPLDDSVVMKGIENPSSYYVVLGQPHAIVPIEEYDGSMTTSSVMRSSEAAYIIGKDEQYREITSEDEKGQYWFGAVAQDEETGGAFVWYSTSSMTSDLGARYNNPYVVLYSITSLCDVETSMFSIDTVDIGSDSLSITGSDASILIAVMLIVLPLAFLAAGIAVYIIRRTR